MFIGQAGDGFEVAVQIPQLLVHGLPSLTFGELFLFDSCQKLLAGFLPVSSGVKIQIV